MSVEVDPTMEAAMAVEMPRAAAEGQPAVPVVDPALVAQLMARAQRQGLSVEGEGGLLAQLTKLVLESALDGEITAHLGYEKHGRAEEPDGNSRNGTRSKTVLTKAGPVQIDVPRAWAGTFEPMVVAKRQRRLGSIEDIVLSLSARGMTHGDISAHLADVYGSVVSKTTISTIRTRSWTGWPSGRTGRWIRCTRWCSWTASTSRSGTGRSRTPDLRGTSRHGSKHCPDDVQSPKLCCCHQQWDVRTVRSTRTRTKMTARSWTTASPEWRLGSCSCRTFKGHTIVRGKRTSDWPEGSDEVECDRAALWPAGLRAVEFIDKEGRTTSHNSAI
jgi:hypothetical protein